MDSARTWRWRRLGLLALLAGACTRPNPAFRPGSETSENTFQPGRDAAASGGTSGSGGSVSSPDAPLDTGPAVDLITGLLGFWTFEEPGGDTVLDRSGRALDGTLDNLDERARISGSGRSGQVLELPAGATNPGVLIPVTPAVRDLTSFTIAAFGYRTSTAQGVQNAVLSRQLGTGPKQVWDLAFDGSSLSAIMSQELTSNPMSVTADAPAPLFQWLHVAATYDGTELLLYQNGKQVGRANGKWTFPTSENPIFLGTNKNSNNDEPMVGMLDDVLLYSRALTPAEIMALAAGVLPPSR